MGVFAAETQGRQVNKKIISQQCRAINVLLVWKFIISLFSAFSGSKPDVGYVYIIRQKKLVVKWKIKNIGIFLEADFVLFGIRRED